MSDARTYAPGTFNWIELGTTDRDAAKTFYADLFGWETDDEPMPEAGGYSMFRLGGADVGGLYGLNAQQRAQGVPTHWMPYVAVAGADDAAERSKALGGAVVVEPMDVMDLGRMAVLRDPTGAAFSVWEPRAFTGAARAGETGSLVWAELATRDADAAGAYYGGLFGWGTQEQQMGPEGTYTTFSAGEQSVGGMMQMDAQWGDAPPHWMVYFAVEDCDATADRAGDLGASVAVPPTDIPDVGRFAVITDPQGGRFAVIELAPM